MSYSTERTASSQAKASAAVWTSNPSKRIWNHLSRPCFFSCSSFPGIGLNNLSAVAPTDLIASETAEMSSPSFKRITNEPSMAFVGLLIIFWLTAPEFSSGRLSGSAVHAAAREAAIQVISRAVLKCFMFKIWFKSPQSYEKYSLKQRGCIEILRSFSLRYLRRFYPLTFDLLHNYALGYQIEFV